MKSDISILLFVAANSGPPLNAPMHGRSPVYMMPMASGGAAYQAVPPQQYHGSGDGTTNIRPNLSNRRPSLVLAETGRQFAGNPSAPSAPGAAPVVMMVDGKSYEAVQVRNNGGVSFLVHSNRSGGGTNSNQSRPGPPPPGGAQANRQRAEANRQLQATGGAQANRQQQVTGAAQANRQQHGTGGAQASRQHQGSVPPTEPQYRRMSGSTENSSHRSAPPAQSASVKHQQIANMARASEKAKVTTQNRSMQQQKKCEEKGDVEKGRAKQSHKSSNKTASNSVPKRSNPVINLSETGDDEDVRDKHLHLLLQSQPVDADGSMERKRQSSQNDSKPPKRSKPTQATLPSNDHGNASVQKSNSSAGITAVSRSDVSTPPPESTNASVADDFEVKFMNVATDVRPHRDSPMTYLVRQLLGQIEVVGDEPALVLGPHNIMDASRKIRLVINKLVTIAVEKEKREMEAAAQEAAADRNVGKVVEVSTGTNTVSDRGDADSATIEKLQAKIQKQKSTIKKLKTQLKEAPTEPTATSETVPVHRLLKPATAADAKRAPAEAESQDTVATIANLVKRLDEGIKMVQKQRLEIDHLKAQQAKDADIIQQKNVTIKALGRRPPTVGNTETKTMTEKIEKLEQALRDERRKSQKTLSAYMRAAEHAIKICRVKGAVDSGE
jgi:hypothetical protein